MVLDIKLKIPFNSKHDKEVFYSQVQLDRNECMFDLCTYILKTNYMCSVVK